MALGKKEGVIVSLSKHAATEDEKKQGKGSLHYAFQVGATDLRICGYKFRPRVSSEIQCIVPTRNVIVLKVRPKSKGPILFRNSQMASSANPPLRELCGGNATSRASPERQT